MFLNYVEGKSQDFPKEDIMKIRIHNAVRSIQLALSKL